MRETRSSGSVEGVFSNGHPYSDFSSVRSSTHLVRTAPASLSIMKPFLPALADIANEHELIRLNAA